MCTFASVEKALLLAFQDQNHFVVVTFHFYDLKERSNKAIAFVDRDEAKSSDRLLQLEAFNFLCFLSHQVLAHLSSSFILLPIFSINDYQMAGQMIIFLFFLIENYIVPIAMRVKRVNKTILIQEQTTTDKRSKTLPPKLPPKANLRNIIEVTEENQPNPLPKFTQNSKEQPKQQTTEQQTSCVRKYLGCIRNLWRRVFKRSPQLEIDMNDSDLSSIIQKIKSKKTDYAPLLPPQKGNKKVLVLDLDETLIHTTFTKPIKYDFQSEVLFNGKNTKIYTVKRFGLDSFLFEMSKLYELIIFTASQRLYADRIIDMIDPKKRISHRLYRQHCFIINKTYFLKNIRSIGRNTKDVIIVDDNNIAGLLQPQNFYKIQPFEGNEKDRQLCRLSAFLKYIHEKQSISSVKEECREFEDLQINLSENDSSIKSSISEGKSLIERRKSYCNHKKRNSQIENLVTKSTEDENQGEISASDFIKKL